MVQVPNVVDRTEAEAERTLQAANLTVVHGEAQYSDDIAEGNVISSSPAAGTEVEEGTEVTIVVSLGSEPATVPNLKGQTASAAQTALANAGLNGSSSEEYSDSVPSGQVISQSIEAGKKVDKGTTVEYVVSRGPETKYATVPNLIGRTESEARQALRDAGLSVGEVNDDYVSADNVNKVVDQSISAGSSVEEGTSVSFTINLGTEPQPDPPAESGTGTGTGTTQ